MLIAKELIEKSEARFELLTTEPTRNNVADLAEEALMADIDVPAEVTSGNILGKAENRVKRKEMLKALNQEPPDFAFERAIGKNDSVYSNFVDLLHEAKKKVGRIAIKDGNKTLGYATGFMISDELLMTNWHVFRSEAAVKDSVVQFYYEYDTFGNAKTPITFKLNTEGFFYAFKDLDYCVVAVSKTDLTGTHNLSEIGYVYLDPVLGKLGDEGQEALNIIHHPNGDYKQLSIRENIFTKILPTSLWYESDTAPGSSGSPVFNDQWQIVALHHMGVPKKNVNGDYIDKDGNMIPEIDGKWDESKIVWIANEGIRISVILKHLFEKNPGQSILNNIRKPFVNGTAPTSPETGKETDNTPQKSESIADSQNVNISFPAALLRNTGNVSVHINTNQAGVVKTSAPDHAIDLSEDLLEASIQSVKEDSLDFSECRGYQSNFLGINLPFPKPKPEINALVAKLKNSNSRVLKYYHYSVLLHQVRKMPLLSAINVDGDLEKRLDDSKRGTDMWLRDNRLDYDIQLSDAFYKKSGFDRGHMSRREDANWGDTAEDARLFADLTCMHTNACPQVKTLNQSSRKGLWGKLETIVLEHGASKENGRTARISVFNGPIFKETDAVYKGIQIPMEFFKIIAWIDDAGRLKTTAFKLSQSELVGEIDFEALDIDANVEFKQYQCSIRELGEQTRIDFSKLAEFDTFIAGTGPQEILIDSEESLKQIVSNPLKK